MRFSKIKLQMIKEKNFDYNSKAITSPKDIVKYINEYEQLEDAPEENTILICLNNKNQILAYSEIAKGNINSCGLDLKSIFKTVLTSNAGKFILVHNHPTGSAQPSSADLKMTERIKQASAIMNIDFVDHIIVAGNDFVSCMR